MKVNRVGSCAITCQPKTSFRSQYPQHASMKGHDDFVDEKTGKKLRKITFFGGLTLAGFGLLLLHLTKKKPPNNSILSEFKNISEAKEYFEKLGIDTDLRGAKEEHLSLLNRIKENLKQLQEMGVKKDKPDSITISDWKNTAEYEELCKKKGIDMERREGYWAFCSGAENGKSHIFINSNFPSFDKFLHEMGHANHWISKDSFWHSKSYTGQAFADKQLEILNSTDKMYRGTHEAKLSNIFYHSDVHSPSTFIFPNKEGEVRYIHAKGMIDKMYSETSCYDGGKYLTEEVADIFEKLIKGEKLSDESMLYYDFAGGARIPNLQVNGMTYDKYIESLYNNPELIQKLKENVKISKI